MAGPVGLGLCGRTWLIVESGNGVDAAREYVKSEGSKENGCCVAAQLHVAGWQWFVGWSAELEAVWNLQVGGSKVVDLDSSSPECRSFDVAGKGCDWARFEQDVVNVGKVFPFAIWHRRRVGAGAVSAHVVAPRFLLYS